MTNNFDNIEPRDDLVVDSLPHVWKDPGLIPGKGGNFGVLFLFKK